MADFPDDLMLICAQSLMAIEDSWSCEDEIDNYISYCHRYLCPKTLFSQGSCGITSQISCCPVLFLLIYKQAHLLKVPLVPTDLLHLLQILVEIKKAQESCVPANTKKATSWCLNVWKAWREYRQTVNASDTPAHIMIFATNKPEFCRWLCHFVLEVMELNIHQILFISCAEIRQGESS